MGFKHVLLLLIGADEIVRTMDQVKTPSVLLLMLSYPVPDPLRHAMGGHVTHNC